MTGGFAGSDPDGPKDGDGAVFHRKCGHRVLTISTQRDGHFSDDHYCPKCKKDVPSWQLRGPLPLG